MTTHRHWIAAVALAALATAGAAEPVTVERDSALRTEPHTDAEVVGQLAIGATADALARRGAWVQVRSGAATGWLYSFNVRFGTVESAASEAPQRTESMSLLGRLFGPRQRGSVASTIGIRGLDEEDLKQARFDERQMQTLESYAASRQQAEAHAGGAGLSAVTVEYLKLPAAGAGPGQ